ncbi:MAG: hypothetical protein H6523_12860 [Mycolicibacterium sp.]|nr:hypothetical protein [Mycolicibacterium sp.]
MTSSEQHAGAEPADGDGKPSPYKLVGIAAVIVVGLGILGAACGKDSKNTPPAAPATTTNSATTTAEAATTPAARPDPTPEQIQQAFQAFVDERATAGVMLAKAVTGVTVDGGVVTVTMDAAPAVLDASPFDNLAEMFGTPVAFDDDDGIWLRQVVQRVDVVDAGGQSLGSLTATELRKKGTGN